MPNPDIRVVKYGGSVLKSGDAFANAAAYAIEKNAVALPSAISGFTNQFEDIYALRRKNEGQALRLLSESMEKYRAIAEPLPGNLRAKAMDEIGENFKYLVQLLTDGVQNAFEGAPDSVHSPTMLRYYIMAHDKDAVVISGHTAGFILDDHGWVDMKASRVSLSKIGDILKKGQVPVVGGYAGRHRETGDYTLGARNINDGFAAALADAIGASSIELVKDVPAVYRVPEEFGDYGTLYALSYDEARKMSWRGSPVLHPSAIRIAKAGSIPIIVKNMASKGTTISDRTQTTPDMFVAAIVPDEAFMVTVSDDIMDTPEGSGYLARLAQFEHTYGVSIGVVTTDFGVISYTILLGDKKRKDSGEKKLKLHNEELTKYLNSHGYDPLVEGEKVGVITIVGDSMRERPCSMSYLADVIGRKGVSLRASAQSDEKPSPPSVTFIVDSDRLKTSVKALADELFS